MPYLFLSGSKTVPQTCSLFESIIQSSALWNQFIKLDMIESELNQIEVDAILARTHNVNTLCLNIFPLCVTYSA